MRNTHRASILAWQCLFDYPQGRYIGCFDLVGVYFDSR